MKTWSFSHQDFILPSAMYNLYGKINSWNITILSISQCVLAISKHFHSLLMKVEEQWYLLAMLSRSAPASALASSSSVATCGISVIFTSLPSFRRLRSSLSDGVWRWWCLWWWRSFLVLQGKIQDTCNKLNFLRFSCTVKLLVRDYLVKDCTQQRPCYIQWNLSQAWCILGKNLHQTTIWVHLTKYFPYSLPVLSTNLF